MDRPLVIAVDGPSGSGKGELCRRLAASRGLHLLDSGAIYRVLAFAAREAGLALFDEDSLVQEAAAMALSFSAEADGVHVLLGGRDVSREIRTEEAGLNASKVAALPRVRQALLQRQRDFRREPGLVADGRDMGTVVFPDAQVKIFLDASAEVRAQRRCSQLAAAGRECRYEEILADIRARDERDRNRPVAPLRPAPGALVIDSSALGIEQVLEKAAAHVGALGF
ncbi:MAG: (d)CMP kinase [Succinivibrionaceae bacterium]|nr:(d)CMP kinase [Succinivibrionaceae bacterium]